MVIYYIIAGAFILISLKPLKEAAAYRLRKGQWVALAMGLILCSLWLILRPGLWGIIVGAILSYFALTLKYDR